MGFVASAIEQRATRLPGVHPSSGASSSIFGNYGYGDDATGMNLSESEVLGWPALLQALRMLGGCMGMMPCHMYERGSGATRKLTINENHPLHWLLHEEPHPEYTPFEFFFGIPFNATFRGNYFGQILRNRKGEVQHVFPLDTHRMTGIQRVYGKLKFFYRQEDGSTRPFDDSEILHVPGFRDGILGYAINELARTSLAKGVAMDRFGARVFASGMNAAGILESDAGTGDFKNLDEKKKFIQGIKDALMGEDNWHTVIGLPAGMKMRTLGVSAKETQLVEAMTFQVQEAARLTGVPPSLLMENSRSTFTNTEQQMLQFIQLGLGQWVVSVEQRLKKSLMTEAERKKFTIKFLVDALLRTDLKTQNDALRVAVGRPWMSVNEARDLKELAPVAGGNDVLAPLNMANPGGNPGQSDTPAADPQAGADGQAPPQDGDANTRQLTVDSGQLTAREGEKALGQTLGGFA